MSRLSASRRATVQRITLPLLVLLSGILIVLGKTNQLVIESLRNSVMDAAAPTLDVFSQPARLFDAAIDRARDFAAVYRENERLTEENERLMGWQQAARLLASENAELRALLRLVPEPSASFVSARVIANSSGAYVRSVVVNAGRENGVVRGEAAISGDGLVGRVTEVGNRTARVLLITDLNSRVPVVLEGSRQRAVLVGDNTERPTLRYMEAGARARIGDRILTAGQSGVFPPGLPVGIVVSIDGEVPRVAPSAELSRIDYVRLVDYGLAEALPNPVALAPRGGKRADLSAGAQPTRR